jgi:hypothetical protein
MLRRTATSGEGMQMDRNRGDIVRHVMRVRGGLLRAAFGVGCITAAAGLLTSAAHAQTYGGDSGSAWSSLMHAFGMNRAPDADTNIRYDERSPLVVPPSRDLPQPVAAEPVRPDWPKDPAVKPHKRAKSTPPAAPADPAAQADRVPNPPSEKKVWYNPISWFSREEYATFTGEPGRDRLTDPPAGYRTPSPSQPYGVSDKKTDKKPSAADMMLSPATPPAQ